MNPGIGGKPGGAGGAGGGGGGAAIISKIFGRSNTRERDRVVGSGAADAAPDSPRAPGRPGGALAAAVSVPESSPPGSKASLLNGGGGARAAPSGGSRRGLFGSAVSAKSLETAADGAGSKSASNILAAGSSYKRAPGAGATNAAAAVPTGKGATATPAAAADTSIKAAPAVGSPGRPRAESVSVEQALALSPEALAGKTDSELKQLVYKLQNEARNLHNEVREIENRSGSGGSSHHVPALVVEFAEPRHQQRPSMIAAGVEQIRAGLAPPPGSRPRASLLPAPAGAGAAAGGAAAGRPSVAVPLGLQEEDSGFLEGEETAAASVTAATAAAAASARARPAAPAPVHSPPAPPMAPQQRAPPAPAPAAAAAAASAPAPAPAAAATKPAASSGTRKYKLLSVYPLLPPGLRREEWALAQFAIDKRLHQGYASEVYRARDNQSGEVLAVKVYKLSALGELNKVQLIREIRLHGSFVHRHIIELYVAFQENDRVVLAQRYAEGGDLLRALHKAGGRLTERSAVQMVVQPLLNCLVYLHSKGITHRDIKPENILFDGDGVLKLADFGLAINMTEEHAVTRAGTLHYMAPEVVKNPLKDHPDDYKNEVRFHYNAVVDSWAVGCLAYELIVGFPPFMADTQQQVVKNINSHEVRYPKRMSDESIDFIKKALQRDPQDRATTAELIRHPWISLHSRRTSNRQVALESGMGVHKVMADFTAGTAVAKAQMVAGHRAADQGPLREGAKMAPF